MADSKKYDGSQWEHSLRKMTTATADIEPTIYTDGTAITSYTIKGNTVQDGTPTPSAPISVNGVGDKTANLLDYKVLFSNSFVKETASFKYYRIAVTANTQYTLKSNAPASVENAVTTFLYGRSDTMSTANDGLYTDVAKTITSTDDGYVYIAVRKAGTSTAIPSVSETDFDNGTYTIMLNEGSTALPYEPYGYKIPISSGQQTIDIYIGDLPLLKSLDGTAVDEISNGTLTRRVDSDGSVLPTPTTTQITMPSIPTTEGANSITVDTTVQPSEFTATWTGWHDASVKEWDGSEWQ